MIYLTPIIKRITTVASVFALSSALQASSFVLLDDFNEISAGAFTGNSQWTQHSFGGSPSGSFAIADTAPASASDHALFSNTAGSRGLSAALPDSMTLTDTSTNPTGNQVGTLFTRVYVDAFNTGVSFGLTNGTNDFTAFSSMLALNANNGNEPAVFDNGSFRYITNIEMATDAWYNIWVVVDNQSKSWSAYIQGDDINGGTITKMSYSGDDSFSFRSSYGTLNKFMVARGGGSAGYLDDIYFGYGDLSNVNPIPEPQTYAMLFGAIAMGLAVYRRRRA